jgi:hypothetical protein
MAKKIQVLLVDDLDGSQAEESVSFGLDGSVYEIDLNSSHAAQLREALTPFLMAGRKAVAEKRPKGSNRGVRDTSGRARSAEIRAWAKSAGKPINERGRIPAAIVNEFELAHR